MQYSAVHFGELILHRARHLPLFTFFVLFETKLVCYMLNPIESHKSECTEHELFFFFLPAPIHACCILHLILCVSFTFRLQQTLQLRIKNRSHGKAPFVFLVSVHGGVYH
jgi:hypothetical protein